MTNPDDFDNFEDYCAALRRREWLTPAEFACLLQESIAWGAEHHAETVTQYRSECAMFGDAGPGQALAVHQGARMLAEDRARLAAVRRIIANLDA